MNFHKRFILADLYNISVHVYGLISYQRSGSEDVFSKFSCKNIAGKGSRL